MKATYDVIVAGFGTAGSVAAIAAARLGAKVLVLERSTYPGGTMTGGGVPGFYGRHPNGLIKELFDSAKAFLNAHACSMVEGLKMVMEQEALKAGCQLVYGASIYEVLTAGKCVRGVRWSADGEVHEAASSMLIDCTGDAAVCRLAGCDYVVGRASDGLCNPYTFSLLCARNDYPNSVFVANFDAGRIDQMDDARCSRELLRGLAVHLQSDYGADSSVRHELVPSDLCGLREGPHLVTEDFLTLQDFFDGKLDHAEDIVGYAHSNIDTHANDMPLESTLFQDWMVASSMWGTEIWFPVTRGALVPRGWKGLLVAGRHLGVDHDMGHAVRMNDHCGRTGEAAGVMAALASQSDSPHDAMVLSIDQITARLEPMEDPRSENDAFMNLDDEAILKGLAGETPGFAIWSARCRKRRKLLLDCYQNAPEGSNLQANAAFALALLDEKAPLPTLMRLARTRDEYTPKTSRKYNHKRGYVAIYLLGRLGAQEAIPILQDILGDLQMADKYEYHSHAIAALVRIAEAHPDHRRAIAERLLAQVHNPEWSIWARLKGTMQYVPVQQTFRAFVERWAVSGE